MMKNISYIALMGAAFALVSANANASGYQLNEYSAVNLGRAFAGMGIVGDDYSAIAYNPAGMMLKDSGLQIGMSTVQMNSEAKGSVQTAMGTKSKPNGKVNLFKYLPHFFAQKRVNDNLALGFGIFTPFGLATDYNKHWFGATHGTKTALEVVDITPTIAYRFGKLSFGAGWIIRYIHGDLRNEFNLPGGLGHNSVNEMNLDGWSANSWALGTMYEFSEDTRIGFSYRYNNAHTVKGDHKIRGVKGPYAAMNGKYNGRSKMTLPASATLSAYHKLNDKYALTATARWTKWKVFDDFLMTTDFPINHGEPIHEGWRNVITYSLGVDYYKSDALTIRGGIAYDRTPIGSNRYRTLRIPDSDRFWVTAGLSYKKGNFQYDLGYAHLFMRAAHSYNEGANVKFHNYSNMLGLQVQYNF